MLPWVDSCGIMSSSKSSVKHRRNVRNDYGKRRETKNDPVPVNTRGDHGYVGSTPLSRSRRSKSVSSGSRFENACARTARSYQQFGLILAAGTGNTFRWLEKRQFSRTKTNSVFVFCTHVISFVGKCQICRAANT